MWLVGRPLHSADAEDQAVGKTIGLAVFASDALSSTAYATQEILVVLAAAGLGALHQAFPVSIAIVVLLAIVTLSYEQTIHAYPGGGGAYIVARDNLGELPAQIAGAALLTDYILTVAVSVSSGVAQLVSAFPRLFGLRVGIAVTLVVLITIINLRGVKESGKFVAIPSYFFIGIMYLTVGLALFRYFMGTLGHVVDPPPIQHIGEMQGLTLFLLLHAFANGTTALTGVEAISNGVTALLTAAVAVAFAVTKFHEGAWIIVIVIPTLVALFFAIHGHYREAAQVLSLEDFGAPPRVLRHRVILPISGVHRGTVVALRYALALSHDITAVHVSMDAEKAHKVEAKWGLWGNGVRLVILESPYRLLLEPLLDFVKTVADRRQPNETLTIVVPQFVPRKWWHQLLHAQTAVILRLALINRPGIVITSVPYQMDMGDGDAPGTGGNG
jgi:hypothetical protein